MKPNLVLGVGIGLAVGSVLGWLSCRYYVTNLAAAASMVATGKAVDAFEGCQVEDALEFAVRAVTLNPDSSFAQSMLDEFKQKQKTRAANCAANRKN